MNALAWYGMFGAMTVCLGASGNAPPVIDPVPFPPVSGTSLSRAVCWADFDGRGGLDLLVIDAAGALHLVSQVEDRRGRRWVDQPRPNPGIGAPMVAADADGDGDVDLLAAPLASRFLSGSVKVWWNDGTGRFAGSPVAPADGTVLDLGWVDRDNDGLPEPWAVIRGAIGDPSLIVWRRSGSGWSEVWRQPAFVDWASGSNVLWGDFDGEGTIDLVWSSGSPSPGLTRGNVRLEPLTVLLGNGERSMGFARSDFHREPHGLLAYPEGPGGLDLLTTGFSKTQILSSRSSGRNHPPFAPVGLLALVAGGRVRFTWLAAWDPEQAGGLTYNLRVGTQPGGNDVVASLSRSDGRRLVPLDGNCGSRLFRDLELPDTGRRLYWSVQAIDHCLAGGLFAPESQIDVPAFVAPAGSVTLGLQPLTGIVRLSGTAVGAGPVRLQRSIDLREWTTFLQVELAPNGSFEVNLPVDVSSHRGFFRAVRLGTP